MINGRDETFAVKGEFSKSEASILISNCANIEKKLNEAYGPKPGEEVDYIWNPIRFYIHGSTESSTGVINEIIIGVHSSVTVAREGREQLAKLGYDVDELTVW